MNMKSPRLDELYMVSMSHSIAEIVTIVIHSRCCDSLIAYGLYLKRTTRVVVLVCLPVHVKYFDLQECRQLWGELKHVLKH